MMKRHGHLFQGRYKAIPVQTDPRDGGLEYFRQISTYIHLRKAKTTVTGVWLAERLQMGHRVNASKAISRFRNSGDREIEKLKNKLLQSTALYTR